MTQQERLIKQFEIATKALEDIKNETTDAVSVIAGYALQKIKDLNPCNHEYEPVMLEDNSMSAKCRLCGKLFKEIEDADADGM